MQNGHINKCDCFKFISVMSVLKHKLIYLKEEEDEDEEKNEEKCSFFAVKC